MENLFEKLGEMFKPESENTPFVAKTKDDVLIRKSSQKPTYFNKEWLKNCRIISYNQGKYSKFLTLDCFDEVFWISTTGSHINAIGYTNGKPVILKLKKC